MDTWFQDRNRAKDRQTQKGLAPTGPFLGAISVVNPESETMNVEFQAGIKNVRVLHPYMGVSSWIRSIPDSGMATLMQMRFDTKDPETILYYNDADIPVSRLDKYHSDNPIEPYRPLSPGEMHIASRGHSESFFARRPYQETRAGLARLWLDQDNAEIGAKAPLHTQKLHQHSESSNSLGDEIRFGVVKRAVPGKIGSFSYPTGFHGGYAKEYVRILKKGPGSGELFPLVDFREGDVSDDLGNAINGSILGSPLILRWLANGPANESVTFEIDRSGNVGAKLPGGASTGIKIEVPSSDISFQIGRNFQMKAQQNVDITSTSASINASTKATIDSPDINLGGKTPIDYLIKGTQYRIAESTKHNQLTSALSSLSTKLGVVAGILTSAGTALTAPGGPSVAGPMIASVGGTLASAVADLGLIISAISAFEAGSSGYLSVTTKVR